MDKTETEAQLMAFQLPDISGGISAGNKAVVSATVHIEHKQTPNDLNSKSASDQDTDTSGIESPTELSDKPKCDDENVDEEEEEYMDDDMEFIGDSDDPMEFGNFGLNDSPSSMDNHTEENANSKGEKEKPSQTSPCGVNPEQAKMELFWRLMDMGFSRERTVEAVHDKGFTELEAAAEYLLSTGNLEGYSVEKTAPSEHKYENNRVTPNNPVQFSKAVSREANLLRSSLPDGIYVRSFEDRMDLYSVMIKGPRNTPYEDGLFFFDVQLSASYPKNPPKFHYHSYSRRLNPNLYVDGKVCVSLLGTWSGQGSENWDPINSNLLQVLVSIQGLILVNEPYFNEPGYASQKGTTDGKKMSRVYNEMVILENLTSLIRLAENPPALFSNEVREHLIETSSGLRKRLETWLETCKHENTSSSKQDLANVGACRYTNRDVKISLPNVSNTHIMTESSSFQSSNSNPEVSSTTTLANAIQFQSKDDYSTLLSSKPAFEVPDFPLAPISSSFSSRLTHSLEILDKSIKKLLDRDPLSSRS